MSQDHAKDRAVLEIVDIVIRYRWRFVVPAFVVAIVVLAGSLTLPKKYRASGIFERQQDIVLSEMKRGATQSYQSASRVQLQVIASEPAVDQLLREIEPELRSIPGYQTPSSIENLRRKILAHTLVRNDLSSSDLDRIRISFTAEHPRVAALVVNGLIQRYIARSRAAMDQELSETRDFFSKEVDRYRVRIERLEDELLRFEIQNARLLPDNPNSMQAQVQRLELQLEELKSDREGAELRIRSIQRAIDEEPANIPAIHHAKNPELTRLEQELRALQETRDEYVNVYKMKPAHPDMVSIEEQIAAKKKKIDATDREVVVGREFTSNPKRAELELRLSDAESQLQTVNHRIDAVRKKIEQSSVNLPEVLPVRTKARKLEREIEQARRQLGFWEDRLSRVELALTAEDGNRGLNLNFIRPAQANPHPVSPRLSQVMLATVLLSLAAGSLAVFFAYRSDDSYTSGHRLASETRLPLLGTVSELVTRRYRRRRRLRQLTLYPLYAAVIIATLGALTAVVYTELEAPEKLPWLRGESTGHASQPTDANGSSASPSAAAPMPTLDAPKNAQPDIRPDTRGDTRADIQAQARRQPVTPAGEALAHAESSR